MISEKVLNKNGKTLLLAPWQQKDEKVRLNKEDGKGNSFEMSLFPAAS